jgi:hypothetical protein
MSGGRRRTGQRVGGALLAPGEETTRIRRFTCTFHTQSGQVGAMTVRGR